MTAVAPWRALRSSNKAAADPPPPQKRVAQMKFCFQSEHNRSARNIFVHIIRKSGQFEPSIPATLVQDVPGAVILSSLLHVH